MLPDSMDGLIYFKSPKNAIGTATIHMLNNIQKIDEDASVSIILHCCYIEQSSPSTGNYWMLVALGYQYLNARHLTASKMRSDTSGNAKYSMTIMACMMRFCKLLVTSPFMVPLYPFHLKVSLQHFCAK